MEGKESKKGIGYSLLYGVAYLHALLPFRVLYVLSDILYLLAYYVARYRRKIVRKNLKNAFPEKTEKSIVKIEKKFYRHLCDYFFETLKMLRFTDKEVRKRFKLENPDIFNQLTANGKSCILSLGHYANWEWVPSIVLNFRPGLGQGFIYKELHSKVFDQLFLKMRTRFDPIPIEMHNAFRQMIRLQNEGKTMVVGFLSDQRPSKRQGHYWTTFMNQPTPVQTGMEKIARHLGTSVVYLDIQKVKRGYYSGKFFVITSDASKEDEYTITEQYLRKLEKSVMREPAYYLWSHDRWKFKKPGN
ncbi:lysophospholipid acyltransferase family protein [Proteiniphilum sp. UBA5384]|uniref:lysophospholipid acyltransferase family protein n=1 Tax=Proteiniphilum sp. UBA5384 TaxID=1947279 RepID=UPI0025F77A77|nr:lysophospholipid acyltransferase family protein [Proteiniphilum sp. UBA5384]